MFITVSNKVSKVRWAFLLITISTVLFPTSALGGSYIYGSDIRKPISEHAWIISQTAVRCTATCYPEERCKSPQRVGGQWEKEDIPQLDYYYSLMDSNIKGNGGNPAYASCTQYVCAVLSTIDDTAYRGSDNPIKFISYASSNKDKYECLGNIPFSELRDGDILASNTHTAIYTKEAAESYYGTSLGNVSEAGYTTYSYPGVDCWYTLGRHTLGELDKWNDYIIFRPI